MCCQTHILPVTLSDARLSKLHWIAIFSGIVFLISSLLYSRLVDGTPHIFAARHILLCLMLALTLISQFGIIPRMDTLRSALGEVSDRAHRQSRPHAV